MPEQIEHLVDKGSLVDVAICPLDVFDVDLLRDDFPILSKRVHGKRLIYLDNAATSQKPHQVIDAIKLYYEAQNANIHRGVHFLSELATRLHDQARNSVKRLINARDDREVIFTRGTTESINLVASSYGGKYIRRGDEILISTMEHHSNIVPWQLLCERVGAKLRIIPIDDDGDIIFDEYLKLLNERTKIVSIVHVSNSLGTVNPVAKITRAAHEAGAVVVVDGAQSMAHMTVDVQALDCDFFAFSGHKMFGPTGIGVLYGKEKLLDDMPPYQGGGDMIRSVSFSGTTYNDLPHKFEAGTPDIAGAVGLAKAVEYLLSVGYSKIQEHEDVLVQRAHAALSEIEGVRIIGNARKKASVVAFVMDGIHPHDVGTILDQNGIAVRTGHHCTQPLMERYDLPATTRASFALYNTREEIDRLVEGLYGIMRLFK